MEKLDYKKTYKQLYNTKKEPTLVDVPELQYLAIDGHGDPNTSEAFKTAVEALFTVSYSIKFSVKKSLGKDYSVMPLEGLWWTADMRKFGTKDKSNWDWTLIVMQPDFITEIIVEENKQSAFKKKGNPDILKLRLIKLAEGKSVQILHIGSYASETENIQKIHAKIRELGGKFDGLVQKHHEIYLSDMRKVAPEKLKTIVRQSFVY